MLQNWQARTGKTHSALKDRVALRRHLIPIWEAYNDLATERAAGGGIPSQAIESWARLHGWVAPGSSRLLYHAIKSLDFAYLEEARERTA